MGYEKKAYVVLIISLYWKKDFQESTSKIQMLMLGLTQSSHFGLWDIIPSMVLTHRHIGSVTKYVKQCITVDLFPHILANVVDIQKVHLLLHTPVLNKTPS